MRTRVFPLALGATLSCSLGLDASKIDAGGATPDGGGPPPPPIDGSSPPPDVNAPDVADAAIPPPSTTCTQDSDCARGAGGCISAGTCDPAAHVCVDPICPSTNGCQVQVCDATTNTCGAPRPVSFFAGSFPVAGGGVGCGGSPASCVAAEFPFLFVGTTNGVVAYDVSDPTAAAPPQVALGGLAFLPSLLVANGRRVYFVGGLQGAGPVFHVPVAWVDVPQLPGLSLDVSTAFVAYSEPRLDLAFPSDSGGLYLVNGDATKFFPTARLGAPIAASAAPSFFPCAGIAANAGLVAASGGRFVAMRWDSAGTSPSYDEELSLVNGAGTSAAQATSPEQPATAMGTVVGVGAVTSASGGEVLWSVATLGSPDGGPFVTPSARLAWLVNDGSSGFDESAHLDVESYAVPPSAGTQTVAGPVAALDPNTAVVLAAADGTSFQQSSVQVAQRSGTSASLLAGRRHVIGATVGQVGVATSNGMAYVLVLSDPQNNQSAEVQVLAPSCANGDGG